ncbi:MAG: D-2-hydroxyacid dehydrogenase [Acidimicrobiia bacterium]|nr:D-2-hydroxyacid dehydrogenase [Acidimicrobiia bacterium]
MLPLIALLRRTVASGLVSDTQVVVGIFYPSNWFGDADGFAREVAALKALDPRVRVITERYDETHELRSARGTPGAKDQNLRGRAPALTKAQRKAFAMINVAVAIDLPYDVATHAPNLVWVQSVGAGTGQLQSAGLADVGVRLTSAAGVNAVGIAEFALARVLQHWKRLPVLDAARERHEWMPVYGRQLAGSTLGLIGLGAINSAVASRAKAFGMRVLATRRSATPGATALDIDELFPPGDLHAMLVQCDAVVAAVPETPETTGMMDAAAFAAMQQGSFFCNVGRGSFVDEPALIHALESGHLGAAAIDVASVEPLPGDHPLWDAPNLYISPHAAAVPGALFVNLHELFRENLTRFLANEPLRNEVDLARGY